MNRKFLPQLHRATPAARAPVAGWGRDNDLKTSANMEESVYTTMKTIGLIISLLVAVTASAQSKPASTKPATKPTTTKPAPAAAAVATQTNQTQYCCRHAVRIFDNHATAKLTPLFEWWKNHTTAGEPTTGKDPSRPLSAWQRITGTKVNDLGSEWVVDAEIYTSPTAHTTARIILKNPPSAEEQAFSNLKIQIATDDQQIADDQKNYQTQTTAAQKAGAKKASKKSKTNTGAKQAAQDRNAAAAALDDQKKLEAERTLAQKQFDAIPAVKGKYQIDWFAVDTGRKKQGVPIYDLGQVDASSP